MKMIIIYAVVTLAALALCDLLITQLVKDKRKRKVWITVSDVLITVVSGILLYLYMAGGGALFSSGRAMEKDWIYGTLPEKLWNGQRTDLANAEWKRVSDLLQDYGNQAIRAFEDAGDEEDLNGLFAASLFGMEDFYLLGSSASEKKRKAQVNEFKKNYEAVLDNLHENMSAFLQSGTPGSAGAGYTDAQLCKLLLGTPGAVAAPSAETQREIARNLVAGAVSGYPRPTVSSCSYDRKAKEWTVRMDNAPTQTVRFFKRDDGDTDVEWTGNDGYVPKRMPAGAQEPASAGAVSQEPAEPGVYEEEEEGLGDDIAESTNYTLKGFLITDDGRKTAIDMTITEAGVAEEDDSYALDGFYHYESQPATSVIHLEGYALYGKNGWAEWVLISEGGKERFNLSVSGTSSDVDGTWRMYPDAESCKAGGDDFVKKMKVELH